MVVTVEMKNDRDGRFFNFLRSHAVELITTKYFAFFFYSLLLQARTIVDRTHANLFAYCLYSVFFTNKT